METLWWNFSAYSGMIDAAPNPFAAARICCPSTFA